MTSAFQFSIDSDGIAKVVFDLPGEKVNKLSHVVFKQFKELIEMLKERKDIKALLFISGKKDIFVAGADLKENIAAFKNPDIVKELLGTARQALLDLKTLPFPTIALIHGACVGGGLEMALLFDYRVVTDDPKTSLAFPETSIGIIPGWGGTQTAPRLIGLTKATEMIVSGKPLNAMQAYKAHLADAIVAPEFLEEKGKEFAKVILAGGFTRQKKRSFLEGNPIGRAFIFSQFRKAILKTTKGFYPAPLIALDVIKKTYGLPLEQGLKIEAESLEKLLQTDMTIPRNLVSIFFGREKLKKNGGYTGALPTVSPVTDAAVLGAGTMGGGIAYLFSNAKIPVRMKDINWEMIGKGTSTIWEILQKGVKRKKIKKGEEEIRFHDSSWTLDYSGFEKKDFVLEAVIEKVEIKHKVYAEVEQKVSKETIIATNTSSLRVADLCSKMEHPERFIGMHFFNPAHVMPLVEIVKGPHTTDEVLAKTIDLAKKLGKVPLVVKDCNGFLVNRILFAAALEAIRLIQEGASVEQVDKAALAFGMPMGLCEVMDLTGIDVNYHVAHVFHQAYGERMAVPELLNSLYEAKYLGQKTGKGFYIYEGKSKKVNPLIPIKNVELNFERVILSMINEASRCLEEQIVTEPEYIDLALVLGAGFPPFRGGILRYADKLGLKYVYEKLSNPTALIEKMAKENQTFYKD